MHKYVRISRSNSSWLQYFPYIVYVRKIKIKSDHILKTFVASELKTHSLWPIFLLTVNFPSRENVDSFFFLKITNYTLIPENFKNFQIQDALFISSFIYKHQISWTEKESVEIFYDASPSSLFLHKSVFVFLGHMRKPWLWLISLKISDSIIFQRQQIY